jgi:hypothetical protein
MNANDIVKAMQRHGVEYAWDVREVEGPGDLYQILEGSALVCRAMSEVTPDTDQKCLLAAAEALERAARNL